MRLQFGDVSDKFSFNGSKSGDWAMWRRLRQIQLSTFEVVAFLAERGQLHEAGGAVFDHSP